jgi:choline transport protein
MAILGCIYLGSSTAFNALVGCNVLLANISYSFPIGLMLFGARDFMGPSTFPLGDVLGPFVNLIALAWIVFMIVFFNFPFKMPVDASNMSE